MAFNHWTAVLACGLAALICILAQPDHDYQQDENEAAVVEGNNHFGNVWLQIQAQRSDAGNIFLSPFSAHCILSLTSIGAVGSTFTNMAQVLNVPENKTVIASGYHSLIRSLQEAGEGNITLDTANRIYVDNSFTIKKDFKDIAINDFYSDIVSVDFAGNPDQARESINQWVEDQTNDRIKDLLPEGSVGTDTRTVLVNAIYFKGMWQSQFDKVNTRSEPFYVTCDETKSVEMMSQTNDMMYGDFGNYHVVQLDYVGKRLHMMVILPKVCGDITQLEENAESLNFTEMHMNMNSQKVHVTMPKFRIEQTIHMNQDLEDMGMTEMFSPSANFSGIADETLSVSTVIQKTFVEVSEEGTEAAAATAVGIRLTSVVINEHQIEFRADHPFLVVIMDGYSEAVIFLGGYRGN